MPLIRLSADRAHIIVVSVGSHCAPAGHRAHPTHASHPTHDAGRSPPHEIVAGGAQDRAPALAQAAWAGRDRRPARDRPFKAGRNGKRRLAGRSGDDHGSHRQAGGKRSRLPRPRPLHRGSPRCHNRRCARSGDGADRRDGGSFRDHRLHRFGLDRPALPGLPGPELRGQVVPGQPQQPFADDIALHLAGSAGDGQAVVRVPAPPSAPPPRRCGCSQRCSPGADSRTTTSRCSRRSCR